MRVLLTISYINIMLNIIPTLYAGYIVSVHRMVTRNRPVDPGSIQGSHRPIVYILHDDKIYNTRERPSVKFVKLSINNHIVGLVHKHHIMYEI